MIRLEITNDGTGNSTWGNYEVVLYLPRERHSVRIERYHRRNGWDGLVFLAIRQLHEKMKGGEHMTELQEGSRVEITYSGMGSHQEIVRNLAQNLQKNTPEGFTLEQVMIDGKEVSSDELSNSLDES